MGRVRALNGRTERSRAAEPIRLWDVNSQSVRTVKRAQQEPIFVEERRISHRRDQLKRLEEASQ
ncbi:MAG: hypothetical protein K2N94_01340 [Lachnospiraceae bacterium]|nr:hypothetical protein [Lachnospiraceae bacterium]